MSIHNWTVDELRAAAWTEEEIQEELAERKRLGLPEHPEPDPAAKAAQPRQRPQED